MPKPKVQVRHFYTIFVGGQEIEISANEAEELHGQLAALLKIDPVVIREYIPNQLPQPQLPQRWDDSTSTPVFPGIFQSPPTGRSIKSTSNELIQTITLAGTADAIFV